ncbi:B3 domain-containing protein Os01g0905400-like isoform X2 [Ananas comosus]|uniref:B3 domain-containing protein Os01g0905400-like isoform X2 n=1 Tax=Ananas comosus TaxID=4615 RepID=A0A6P5F234_ANACO|nr:B3 domain-containing protein Os01g0905400-like isoform X2 [Ananas comosus]
MVEEESKENGKIQKESKSGSPKKRHACGKCTRKCLKIHGKCTSLVLPPPPPPTPSSLSFFKIMVGDFSELLYVPPMFAKAIGDLADQNVYLQDSYGYRWRVKTCSMNGALAFGHGWRNFALDHAIKFGELLVFKQISKHGFSVQIFATTARERLHLCERNKRSNKRKRRRKKEPANNLCLNDIQNNSDASEKRLCILDKDSPKDEKIIDATNVMDVKSLEVAEKDCSQYIGELGGFQNMPEVESLSYWKENNVKSDHSIETNFAIEGDSAAALVWSEDMVDLNSSFNQELIMDPPIDAMPSETSQTLCYSHDTEKLEATEEMSRRSPSTLVVECEETRNENQNESNLAIIACPLTDESLPTMDCSKGDEEENDVEIKEGEQSNERINSPDPEVGEQSNERINSPDPEVGEQSDERINSPDPDERINSPDLEVGEQSNERANSPDLEVGEQTNERINSPDLEVGEQSNERVNSPDLEVGEQTNERINSPDLEVGEQTNERINSPDLEVGEQSNERINSPDPEVACGELDVENSTENVSGAPQISDAVSDQKDEGDLVCSHDVASEVVMQDMTCLGQDQESNGKIGESGNAPTSTTNGKDEIVCFSRKVTRKRRNKDSLHKNGGDLPFNASTLDGADTEKETPKSSCEDTLYGKENHGPGSPPMLLCNKEEDQSLGAKIIADDVMIDNSHQSEIPLQAVKIESEDPIDAEPLNNGNFGVSISVTAQSWLELPKRLPSSLGKMKTGRKVVVLRDPCMRLWPVLYHESARFVGFIGGWDDFTAANHLQHGDDCVFELSGASETVLQVRISK